MSDFVCRPAGEQYYTRIVDLVPCSSGSSSCCCPLSHSLPVLCPVLCPELKGLYEDLGWCIHETRG